MNIDYLNDDDEQFSLTSVLTLTSVTGPESSSAVSSDLPRSSLRLKESRMKDLSIHIFRYIVSMARASLGILGASVFIYICKTMSMMSY